MSKLQIFAALLSFLWLIVMLAVFTGNLSGPASPTVALIILTFAVYALYAAHGAFRLTPFIGKILIATSFILLLSQLLSATQELCSVPIRSFAVSH